MVEQFVFKHPLQHRSSESKLHLVPARAVFVVLFVKFAGVELGVPVILSLFTRAWVGSVSRHAGD